MKKIVFFITLLMLLPVSLVAQRANTLRGRVSDAHTGESIIGVLIVVDGAGSKNTISGLDGSFAISGVTSFPAKLSVSHIGYDNQTLSVEEGIPVEIALEPNVQYISQIVIAARRNGETEGSARYSEKIAENLINVMPARSIEISPDLTVANVMQRVSGVSVEKDGQGEGRYPIIRGMNKQYSYTLVNGLKVPSPDDKNRYVPMDIFPSDLLESLEVSKTLTADMEGDAIGGAINMVMKNAPEEFTLRANVATGYSHYLFNNPYYTFDRKSVSAKSPAEIHGNEYIATEADFPIKNLKLKKTTALPDLTAGLTVGGRVGKKKKLGLLFGGSFQNFNRATESNFFMLYYEMGADNTPYFHQMRNRTYSTRQTRTGINAKADLRIDRNNRLDLSYLYVNLDQRQTRMSADTSINHPPSRIGPGTGQVTMAWRTHFQRQSIHNVAMRGHHKITRGLNANWTVAYSVATSDLPDQAAFSTTHDVKKDGVTPQLLEQMTRRWIHTSDADLNAKADIIYKPIASFPMEISVGGLYRSKKRDNNFNQYSLTPRFVNGSQPQQYTDIEDADYYFETGKGYGTISTPNTYTTNEDIIAFYGQLKFNFKKFEIIAGVRNEITDSSYDTQMPEEAEGKFGGNNYSDFLPSLNVKFRINATQNLRASYYRAICRPGFFDVVPYEMETEGYDELGNPYLRRTVADNVDLRYEWFPSNGIDQLLVGAFYKNLIDPIEYVTIAPGGHDRLATMPQNCGNAVNWGLELVAAKYWRYFGVTLNYTFTMSSITTDKIYKGEDKLNVNVRETRPLQGQSMHIGNASLVFRHQPMGINLQLSAVFTGSRIATVSPYKGLDYWQGDYFQLDFSGEKTIFKNDILFVKISNIIGTPLIEYVKKPNIQGDFIPMQSDNDRMMVRREVYQPTYQLGLRFRF